MKKLKLALLVAAPLLLAACSSSQIPDEPTSAGGAAPAVSPEGLDHPYGQAYGHGGGRNNFVEDERGN